MLSCGYECDADVPLIWKGFRSRVRSMDVSPDAAPIVVIREGMGPEVLLVHGGASPATTWSGLEDLSKRWTLAYMYRRGFDPSPQPPGGHQDFELDAADLLEMLDNRPHIVAHSYGAVGAVIAAIQNPAQVRSLTLLEPALFLPVDDPEVARFRRMGDAVLTHGLDTEPAALREFLKIAGAPVRDQGPLPEEVRRGVRRAHGSRSPGEARPALDVLRDAQTPTLVASGDHHPAVERMCDAVAIAVGARRTKAPGAGHFVAAAPGFADRLEQFLIWAR
jgi:pimeloyl-ACP methyl ester carboxylesterase